jgi:S1-C subfamily serine protease
MNNAAIAEVRLKASSSALKRWRMVVGVGKVPAELIQNLGRFSDLAATGDFVSVSEGTVKSIGELYAQAAGTNDSHPYDVKTGWLYIPCLATKGEDDEKAPVPDDQPKPRRPASFGTNEIRICATGSGFAVGPDLIVTNRHVAEGAQGFALHQEGVKLAKLSGEVVSLCDDADVALLRFTGLNATPISLSDALPRLSAAVRVLGYPETTLLGNSLKVTSGSVVGLPSQDAGGEPEVAQMILLDATSNHGNSGGPVVNAKGDVLGVLTLGIKVDQQYSAAVPSTIVRTFLATNGVRTDKLLAPAETIEDAQWEDVVARAAPSTFQVLVMGLPEQAAWATRKTPVDADRPKRPVKWNGFEDRWCMHCNGLAHVNCPNRACRVGVIVYRESVIVRVPGGRDVTKWETRQKNCGTCGGDGRIPCPYCSNGFDSSIR